MSNEEFSLDNNAVVNCEGGTCPVGQSSRIYFDGDTDGDSHMGVTSVTFCNPLTGSCTTNEWMSVGRDFNVEGGVDVDDFVSANFADREAVFPMHLQTEDNGWEGLAIEANEDHEHGWSLATGRNSENLRFSFSDDLSNTDDLNQQAILRSDGDLSISGTLSESSDRNLKEDIEYLDNVLDDVLSLDAAEYSYINSNEPGERDFGFIAQEVKEVFPEAVTYDDKIDQYGLTYSGFSALAIQAIQEQQEIIDQKTTEVDKLRSEVDEMESRLDELESRL